MTFDVFDERSTLGPVLHFFQSIFAVAKSISTVQLYNYYVVALTQPLNHEKQPQSGCPHTFGHEKLSLGSWGLGRLIPHVVPRFRLG